MTVALSARWDAYPERFDWIADNGFAVAYTPGPDALHLLKDHGLTLAILTRNSRRCSEIVVERFSLPVDAIFAREDAPPKPDRESVLTVCTHCNVPPDKTLVVGDYIFDVQAGKNAGALAALLETPKLKGVACEADIRLKTLSDLIGFLNL